MRSEGVGHPAVPAPIGEGFGSGDAGFSLHSLYVIENTMIGGGFNLGEFSGFRRAAGITNIFCHARVTSILRRTRVSDDTGVWGPRRTRHGS